jgi:hypothetical protein
MAMPHEHDGAHEAIENFLKEGIMLVTQYAKHHKAQRLAAQAEAARQDHELKIAGRRERFQHDFAAKLGLEQASAAMRYSQVDKQEFWDNSDAPTILDTYRDAAVHADQNPQAAEAVEVMADYMKAHMGIDVGKISEGAEATEATEDLGVNEQLEADRGVGVDREIAGLEQQFNANASVDELSAGMQDLHLSQALTAAASPHTIDQVADAAEADTETVYARHTEQETDLAGERDNLDR